MGIRSMILCFWTIQVELFILGDGSIVGVLGCIRSSGAWQMNEGINQIFISHEFMTYLLVIHMKLAIFIFILFLFFCILRFSLCGNLWFLDDKVIRLLVGIFSFLGIHKGMGTLLSRSLPHDMQGG